MPGPGRGRVRKEEAVRPLAPSPAAQNPEAAAQCQAAEHWPARAQSQAPADGVNPAEKPRLSAFSSALSLCPGVCQMASLSTAAL